MDNTSIITQVANPKEEESISSSQDKVSQSNSSLKKHRSRSIFSPFFCCFRNYNDYHADPPPSNNKTLSLPPPPEENGSPPKPPAKSLLPEPISNADFIVPVEIDGTVHQVYVLKRPHYADPVADLLDQWGVFRARLFRESCVFHRGNYVPVQSWFDDLTDTELLDLIPQFEGLAKEEDIYSLLQSVRNR
ncbi:hypothetical protein F7725_029127 [Dissostichus mawsoni]|uniref:Mitochondrial import inner membrane translocase subunit TIM50 n=1 Tax=Dissostichus mawsoni TaxID=36200 RepID=A0A7J5XJ12_DISMA|nr:hypothetical protein F7725_029127 [Dissostichus mawsoni]